MGRIADALKRAEQERQTRQTGAPAHPMVDPPAMCETGDVEVWRGERATQIDPSKLDEALIPFMDKSAPVTEQYRSLRTRLLSANPQNKHQVIAVTSSASREGRSISVLNIAATFADIRHLKIAVLDADLRSGSLAHKLGLPASPGLADVLEGRAEFKDIVQETPLPNLSLIPAGTTTTSAPADLLTSPALAATLQAARSRFHYVLVDTPAAATFTDAGIVGQLCDGAILMVYLHRTNEYLAKRTVRMLQGSNVPVLGCVLIGRETPSSHNLGNRVTRYVHTNENSPTTNKVLGRES